MEERYRKLVENKKIIFVGPSPLLENKKRGEWIDSFDLVVRTNGASLLLDDENFQRDYGKRMDILCSNVQFHREMRPFPVIEWVRKYGLKFINFKTTAGKYKEVYEKFVPTRTLESAIKEIHKTVKSALMTPIFLLDILMFNPKEVYVTGIDFYINKPNVFIPNDYREYCKGYLPQKIVDKANVDNIGRVDPHNQYTNCRVIYNLYLNNRIKTDEEIVFIMQHIMNNPEKFTPEAKRKMEMI